MIRDHRPFDHMAEWSDAAQRADCARCVGRVLLAGLVPTVSSTAVNSAAVNRWEQIRRKSVEVHADDARRQPLLPGARRGPSTTHDLISAALSQNIRSMTTRASAGGMHVK